VIILQEINISHLGKRKIIFKYAFPRDMLIPWRVVKMGSFFQIPGEHLKTGNHDLGYKWDEMGPIHGRK